MRMCSCSAMQWVCCNLTACGACVVVFMHVWVLLSWSVCVHVCLCLCMVSSLWESLCVCVCVHALRLCVHMSCSAFTCGPLLSWTCIRTNSVLVTLVRQSCSCECIAAFVRVTLLCFFIFWFERAGSSEASQIRGTSEPQVDENLRHIGLHAIVSPSYL